VHDDVVSAESLEIEDPMTRPAVIRKIRFPGVPPYTGWAVGIAALVVLGFLLFPNAPEGLP
jgi:hypothetical protein